MSEWQLLADQTTQSLVPGIISGLISNGLSSLMAQMSAKVRRRAGPVSVPALDEIVRAGLAERLRRPLPDSAAQGSEQIELLRRFLGSPAVETIARQLYAALLVKTDRAKHLEDLQTTFRTCLSLHLGLSVSAAADLADGLFQLLQQGCDAALKHPMAKDALAALEARDPQQHRVLRDELAAIRQSLTFLRQRQQLDIAAILRFEAQYRKAVGERHSRIQLPFMERERRYPLNDIYVPPHMIVEAHGWQQENEPLALDAFMANAYRAVVLGDPGGGKSTLTQKIAHELATRHPERLFGGRTLTPVLIVLRDFASIKRQEHCSIAAYIAKKAAESYQVPAPDGAVEYLLHQGHLLVIFDGLDELLDIGQRREIRNDIESFCSHYAAVPVLVTSRAIGYEYAPMDQQRFHTYRLGSFTQEQIETYATKWFRLQADGAAGAATQSGAFLRESTHLADLCENPLLLSLMCILYRGEGYIPRNRPTLYEKCATYLFEQWDQHRQIRFPLSFEPDIQEALRHIAYTLFTEPDLSRGITERALVQRMTDYLYRRRFEERSRAERAAAEFIRFCRERMWVFAEVGSQNNEPLFQFTHRTFLEYFAADHLVHQYETTAALCDALLPRIERNEWDVVAQLAFHIRARQQTDAAKRMLEILLARAETSAFRERCSLLRFGARMVTFLRLPPPTLRQLTVACLACSLDRESHGSSRSNAPRPTDVDVEDLLRPLLMTDADDRAAIADSLQGWLIDRITHGDEATATLALALALDLDTVLWHRSGLGRDQRDFWRNRADEIARTCADRLKWLAAQEPLYSGAAYRRGLVSLPEVLTWHGAAGLFYEGRLLLSRTRYSSIAWHLLLQAVSPSVLPAYHSALREIGALLLTVAPPWVNPALLSDDVWFGIMLHADRHYTRSADEVSPAPAPDEAVLFGAFVLLAPWMERDGLERHEFLTKRGSHPLLAPLQPLFLARIKEATTAAAEAALDRCSFGAAERAFAARWVRREFDLAK